MPDQELAQSEEIKKLHIKLKDEIKTAQDLRAYIREEGLRLGVIRLKPKLKEEPVQAEAEKKEKSYEELTPYEKVIKSMYHVLKKPENRRKQDVELFTHYLADSSLSLKESVGALYPVYKPHADLATSISEQTQAEAKLQAARAKTAEATKALEKATKVEVEVEIEPARDKTAEASKALEKATKAREFITPERWENRANVKNAAAHTAVSDAEAAHEAAKKSYIFEIATAAHNRTQSERELAETAKQALTEAMAKEKEAINAEPKNLFFRTIYRAFTSSKSKIEEAQKFVMRKRNLESMKLDAVKEAEENEVLIGRMLTKGDLQAPEIMALNSNNAVSKAIVALGQAKTTLNSKITEKNAAEEEYKKATDSVKEKKESIGNAAQTEMAAKEAEKEAEKEAKLAQEKTAQAILELDRLKAEPIKKVDIEAPKGKKSSFTEAPAKAMAMGKAAAEVVEDKANAAVDRVKSSREKMKGKTQKAAHKLHQMVSTTAAKEPEKDMTAEKLAAIAEIDRITNEFKTQADQGKLTTKQAKLKKGLKKGKKRKGHIEKTLAEIAEPAPAPAAQLHRVEVAEQPAQAGVPEPAPQAAVPTKVAAQPAQAGVPEPAPQAAVPTKVAARPAQAGVPEPAPQAAVPPSTRVATKFKTFKTFIRSLTAPGEQPNTNEPSGTNEPSVRRGRRGRLGGKSG